MRIVPSFLPSPPHACSSASSSCLATISHPFPIATSTHCYLCAEGIIYPFSPLFILPIVIFRPSLSLSLLSLPLVYWIMETRADGKRPVTHPLEDPQGRRPSKDLKRAAEAAQAFTNFSSPQAQKDTKDAEEWIWDTVERAKVDGELDVFKQWVKDPGYTTGRLALYDRALAYYWENKQMFGLLMDERSTRAGDEQRNDKIWRTHCRETHLIHLKLDIIAKKLGISFSPQDSAANLMKGGGIAKADSVPAPQPSKKNE